MLNLTKKELITIVVITLIFKVVFFIFAYFSFHPDSISSFMHENNFSYPKNETQNYLTALKNWDGQHYTYLAQFWYSPNQANNAFFPLYPAVVKILNYLLQNIIISGLIISNIFSLIGIIYFFKITKKLFSSSIAYLSTIFLLIFPTSFYFNLPYSESIFLALTTISIYFALEKKYVLSAFFAFFLPLTRLVGVLIIVPLILIYLQNEKIFFNQLIKKFSQNKKILVLLSPILGILAYFLITYYYLHNPFAGFDAQKNFICSRSFFDLLEIKKMILSFGNTHLSQIFNYNNGLMDQVAIILFIIMLFVSKKIILSWMWYYMLLFGIVPLLSGSTMSYTRFLIVIFPIYIIFAKLFYRKIYLIVPFIVTNIIIWFILIYRFINFRWVA